MAEVTADLVGNKISETITRAASKNNRQDASKLTKSAQTNETSVGVPIEMATERYL